jgi:FMN phosphatase YigB (HAD superfamily)
MTTSVASFDVFDTTITRKVGDPEAVFLLLANRVNSSNQLEITPEMFARLRQRSENLARALDPLHEPDITAIYRVIQSDLDIDDETTAALCAAEVDLERQLAVVVPSVRQLISNARARGAPVAFLSDMYLGAAVIGPILRDFGLLRDGDILLVSSDAGVTKSAGGLYRLLRANVGPNKKIVHHGDNLYSDVSMARSQGIQAKHVPDARLNRYEKILERYKWDTGGLSSVLSGASRLARLSVVAKSAHEMALRDVTASVGAPLLVGFTLWLIERAEKLGIRRLYFVSRDGQALLQIAAILQSKLSTSLELRYLYGGRQAWHLAAAADMSIDDATPLLLRDFYGSYRMLLRRFGLDDQDIEESAGSILPHEGWDEPLGAGTQNCIDSLLSAESVREEFRKRCKYRAATLKQYLNQEGLFDGTSSALVDIGWTGRSAGSLGRIIRAEGFQPPMNFYVGLYDSPPPDVRHEAYLDSLRKSMASSLLGPFVITCEALLSGDHGAVVGFESSRDLIIPRLAAAKNQAAIDWGLPIIRETLETFSRAVHVDSGDVYRNADLRPALTATLSELLLQPTEAESRGLGSYPFEYEPAGGDEASIALAYRGRDAISLLLNGELPYRRWSAASLLLSPPSVRCAIRSVQVLRQRLHRIKTVVSFRP